MKKIILTLILCLLPLIAFGKTSCPKGHIDCPSKCGMCVDENNDGKCDHTQSKSEKKDILPVNSKAKEISQKSIETKSVKKDIPAKKTYKKKPYHIFPISLSLIFLYILTIIGHKKKIIEHRTHFKLWNFALLVTFLISASLGILLIIMINYGIKLKLPFNIILWHTEAGIAMFTISLFHIHWHWRYIKNIFKIQR